MTTRRTSGSSALLSVFAWVAALAGSLAFTPLLSGLDFLLTAALLSSASLAVTLLLRTLHAPAALVLVGQVVALGVWTTVLYYPTTAAAGVLPTGATVEALVVQLATGVETANAYAPPAPAEPGLLLLTATGITACYLLVDLLGVGLGRVPLTGLPLLALYTVPAALAPDGVPALAFAPGAAGFVLLLAYDERERLTHWGRQVSTARGAGSEAERRRLHGSALDASATRVGAVAVLAAVVLPVFIPVLREGPFGDGGGDGDGPGQVRVTNPFVDLRRDLVERSRETALTVRTRSSAVEYFRLAALDEFDGQKWKFSDRDVDGKFDVGGRLSPPPGLDPGVRTRTQRYSVSVSLAFASDWLPTPYAPTRVRVPGQWRYDPQTLDIVAGTNEEDAAGRDYTLTTVEALPTFEQLAGAGGAPASISGRYTDVPDTVPDQVGDLARRIADGGPSRFERAVLLQRWFRSEGGFRYSLEPSAGHSGNEILSFLNNRVGYCEQFAAAMALMARELDIPARVAVGFLAASPSRVSDREFRYTYADLHAWPELYFEGSGWVRFEPTPSSRTGGAPPYTRDDVQAEQSEEGPAPVPLPTEPTPQAPTRDPREEAAAGGRDSGGGSSGAPYLAAGAVLLVLASPAATRAVVRRRRLALTGDDRERAEAVWDELRDTVRDLGQHWPDASPRRTAASLLPLVLTHPQARAAVQRIALTVERARFAREPGDGSSLPQDLAVVTRVLRSRESRLDGLRATLLPRSLRPAYRRQNRDERERFRTPTLDVDATALRPAP